MQSLVQKLLHAIRIEGAALREIVRHGMPDVMLQFLGGIGDELLLTTVAHELRKRKPHLKIWQVSHSAELLYNDPDYHKIFWYEELPNHRYDCRMLRYAQFLRWRRMWLSYSVEVVKGELEIPPNEHILVRLCRKAGIRGTIEIRPYFFLTEEERTKGKIAKDFIVIQNVGDSTHRTFMKNKTWYPERFQQVVNALKDRFSFVQIGTAGDSLLENVLDLRGKTTIRETAAIIANACCFIGTSGFLTHLARAVDTRSIVVYGGREHSSQTGYICNENLNSYVECAPCWRWNLCDYDRKCMDMISVDMVLEAVGKIIRKQNEPLAVETITLQ